jgi:hypothetical protein
MEVMHPYIERSGLRYCTRYCMYSSATHRHVTGFVAAAVLLLLLVLPDSESRTAQTTTLTRRGNLNSNLDLTRNAIPCLYLNSHSVSLNMCAAIAMSAATRSIVPFSASEGQQHCTLRGERRVGTQERASRQSRKSTDRPSGSRTRRLDPSAGLERGWCAQPPKVLHIVPNID